MTVVNQQYRKLNPSGAQPREISEVVNNLLDGKSNNTGTITLNTSGATSTIIYNERIGFDSVILLQPTDDVSATDFYPYGAFQDSTDQSAAAIDVAYPMTFNTVDYTLGVSLVSASQIKVGYSGLYNLQFSSEFINTDTQIHDVSVWIRKNGTDVPSTAGVVSISNRHGTTDGQIITGWNYYIELAKDDYVQLMWKTNSTQVSMQHLPAVTYSAGVTPAVPAAASVIATIQYLSANSYTSNLFTQPYVSSTIKGQATITHPANSVSGMTYKYIVVG